MPTEVDDFLKHYGVTGMKWGVNRGGLKSRVKTAALDSAQRRITTNKEIAAGRGQTRDFRRVALKRYGGLATGAAFSTGNMVLAKERASKLQGQSDRIKSGTTTFKDKMGIAMNTPISGLVVRRTDKRGEPGAAVNKRNTGAKHLGKVLMGVAGAATIAYAVSASKNPAVRAEAKNLVNQGIGLAVNKQQGKNRAKAQKTAYRNERADKFGLPSGPTYQARKGTNGVWS